MDESSIKIVTIIWVGLVPPLLTLIIFTYILLCLETAKIGHYLMCSALIGRLGHCTIVVIIWSIFTLEHWNWPKEMCFILNWAWITFWIGDILNTFFFLVYYSFRYGAKISGKRVSGFLILFFTWMLALLIGGLPVFMESSFHNYNAAQETCVLNFVKSERHVRIAGVLVHIIAPLFCFVLCITINVEFKSHRSKHRLYCRINSLNIEQRELGQSQLDDPASDKSTAESGSNNSSVRTLFNNNKVQATDSLSRKEVRKCGVVERGNGVKECEYTSNIRDTRNMLNVLTVGTILLNSGPQLVLYVMEIASANLGLYTQYILVSFGILHGFGLCIFTCLATYRYSYLARKLLKRFFCRRKKTKTTSTAPQKNNLSTPKAENTKPTSSNIITVSNIVETNNSENRTSGQSGEAVDLDQVTVHEITPVQQDKLGGPPPPPLPTSRHPSFIQHKDPTTSNNTSAVENSKTEQNGQVPKAEEPVDETAGSYEPGNETGVQINIEEYMIDNHATQPTQTHKDVEDIDGGQSNLDMSVQSVNIESIQESNRPKNILDLPVIARSNSAVTVPKRDGEQEMVLIRRTASSAHRSAEQNEGPLVDWRHPGPGTGTLLIRKIQSGDKTYISCDYHHNDISDNIELINGDNDNDSGSYYSEEGSSYYDSDSAGWSHMYTDTDMNETLERNKERRNTLKRTPAKRIPSNDSSLNDEAIKRAKARKKKKVKKKSKKKGKDVEKGLGAALSTIMVMPGTKLSHRPKQTGLENHNTKKISVYISEDIDSKVTSQISPGIGPDGTPIPVPPPPTFTPPPLPVEGNGHRTTDDKDQASNELTESHDPPKQSANELQSDTGNVNNTKAPVKFPATVLPFQTNYTAGSESVHLNDQQSFTKEAPTSQHMELQPHNNPYLPVDTNAETNVNISNNDAAANKYHPSIYSIVKDRTKAQKAWQKAFTALSVTEFLKRKPSNLGIMDNGESVNGSSGLRSRNTVNRTSAHIYVNTGSSGMFADKKQNSVPSDNEDEWNDS